MLKNKIREKERERERSQLEVMLETNDAGHEPETNPI